MKASRGHALHRTQVSDLVRTNHGNPASACGADDKALQGFGIPYIRPTNRSLTAGLAPVHHSSTQTCCNSKHVACRRVGPPATTKTQPSSTTCERRTTAYTRRSPTYQYIPLARLRCRHGGRTTRRAARAVSVLQLFPSRRPRLHHPLSDPPPTGGPNLAILPVVLHTPS
jgi:hypothetical protein